MTKQELNEIEARHKASTQGDWVLVVESGDSSIDMVQHYTIACGDYSVLTEGPEFGPTVEDAESMAHAHQDVPTLIAEVRWLQGELRKSGIDGSA